MLTLVINSNIIAIVTQNVNKRKNMRREKGDVWEFSEKVNAFGF
jgi:hypothetical protein